MEPDLRAFQQYLAGARKVIALIGAGLSASSGLPTFRGAGGLWRQHEAFDLATPEAFENDPGLVWQFYSARRGASLRARPNRGHRALAELARRWPPDRFLTLTQNVDGLSGQADHPQASLVHLHGDLFTVRCTSFVCNYEERTREHPLVPALASAPGDETTPHIPPGELPRCPKCKSLLRPGVVWFGEALPYNAIERADSFIDTDEVDLILVIGMSATVWPAAGYIDEVVQRGGKVAVFNTDSGTSRPEGWFFPGDAAEWLPLALEPIIGKIS